MEPLFGAVIFIFLKFIAIYRYYKKEFFMKWIDGLMADQKKTVFDTTDIIVKSNKLVREFTLKCDSLMEKRLVYAFFSTVDSLNDAENKTYTLSMTDLLRLLDLSDGGFNYSNVRGYLKNINDLSFWQPAIENGRATETIVRIFKQFKMVYKDDDMSTLDYCQYSFTPEICQHLLAQKKFTKLLRKTVMRFKCKYTPDLYEYLVSFCFGEQFKAGAIQHISMAENDLYYHLHLDKSTPAWKITSKILPTVVNEINKFSDTIFIQDYTYEKDSLKTHIANFSITTKVMLLDGDANA